MQVGGVDLYDGLNAGADLFVTYTIDRCGRARRGVLHACCLAGAPA